MMQTYKVSEEDAEIVRKELDKIIQGYKRIILYPYGNIGRFAALYLQKDDEIAVYITTANKEFYAEGMNKFIQLVFQRVGKEKTRRYK